MTKAAQRSLSPTVWLGLLLIAGLVLVVALFRPQASAPDGIQHPAVGRRLGVLQLQPLTGAEEPHTLGGDGSEVTLINFWGTWCYPCRLEMPDLADLQSQLRHRDNFRFLSVSCGSATNTPLEQLRTETEEFLEASGYDFPTYHDRSLAFRLELVETADLGDRFAYPTTVVLDREGTIRGLWIGYHSGVVDQQLQLIEQLLGDDKATVAEAPHEL